MLFQRLNHALLRRNLHTTSKRLETVKATNSTIPENLNRGNIQKSGSATTIAAAILIPAGLFLAYKAYNQPTVGQPREAKVEGQKAGQNAL